MAKCELTLQLEEVQAAYRPGDVVRGWVEVRCDEEVECHGLTAGLRWRTRSKGTPAARVVASEELFQGLWRADTVERYPVALALPAGPFTYEGHNLEVAWELFAEADVPWAFDPAAAREIVLEPDPDAEPDWQRAAGDALHLPPELQAEPAEPSSGLQLSRTQGLGCLLAVLIPVAALMGFAGFKVLGYAAGEVSGNEALAWGFGAAVVLLFVGGGLIKVLRDVLAWGKVGQVSVVVEPRRVRAGENLRVQVTCEPRKNVDLLAATVRLQAHEKVIKDGTEHNRGWTEVVFDQETEVAGACRLERGHPFEAEVAVPVPQQGPATFMTWGNQIIWTATVRLQLAGWPDFVEDRVIQVHP